MGRLIILVTVVLAGCAQQPAATVYLDPTYDLVGQEPPARTIETMQGVFAGVKFGVAPPPPRVGPPPPAPARATPNTAAAAEPPTP